MSDWILVSEGLPEEHPTAVSKLKAGGKYKGLGTKWAGFSQKMSDLVVATCVFPNGERISLPAQTIDGVWNVVWKATCALPSEVIAWMSLPEPYKEDE